jgi:hypothetical protein
MGLDEPLHAFSARSPQEIADHKYAVNAISAQYIAQDVTFRPVALDMADQ